jgi:holo-[acyl-carrier protein] synthase
MPPDAMTDTRAADPGDAADGEGSVTRVLIGTDLVAVDRVEALLAGQPGLAEQIFTKVELAYCASRSRRRHDHLAARFAAKEAVLKALGTGSSAGIEWTDVEVVNGIGGRPSVLLHGRAAAVARRRGVRQTEISLTHTAGLAMANAVILCVGGRHPTVKAISENSHEEGAQR